jgi:MFS family permease
MNTSTIKNSYALHLPLYLLSFIEGGSLMGVEIAGAKIIAPFFGSSLYVWTAVLSTTLLGLASGYYFGGKLSEKQNVFKNLIFISITAAVLVLLMPFLAPLILKPALPLGLKLGITLSSVFILLPVIFCFGMVSPLIIALLTPVGANAGKTAGNIYAVSTLGGILFALSAGLFTIPYLGLKLTLIAIGLLLLFFSALPLILQRNYN